MKSLSLKRTELEDILALLAVEKLQAELAEGASDAITVEFSLGTPLRDIVERVLRETLNALGGNKTASAEALGIDRRTLYRLVARFTDGPTSLRAKAAGLRKRRRR